MAFTKNPMRNKTYLKCNPGDNLSPLEKLLMRHLIAGGNMKTAEKVLNASYQTLGSTACRAKYKLGATNMYQAVIEFTRREEYRTHMSFRERGIGR